MSDSALDVLLWGAEWSPAMAFGVAMIVIFAIDMALRGILSSFGPDSGR